MSHDYSTTARTIRSHILHMLYRGQSAHAGSNLSIVDILCVLYFGIMHIFPDNPLHPERDRFVMSKGHAAAALWATLAERGFFSREHLKTYYKDDGYLPGHVTHGRIPGVEFSTGSLGHGLPFATGVAFAAKRTNAPYRIYVVMSDGELNEGSNWEALLFAPHHKLDNLVVILDYNKIQSLGFVHDTLALEPLAEKLTSFGWQVQEIDGHNHSVLEAALLTLPLTEKPTFLIAHTTKGKGVSYMENSIDWHYWNVDEAKLKSAHEELGIPL